MSEFKVGRIDLGPVEARHLTPTEQRVMDAALRRSVTFVDVDKVVEQYRWDSFTVSGDPASIAAVKRAIQDAEQSEAYRVQILQLRAELFQMRMGRN